MSLRTSSSLCLRTSMNSSTWWWPPPGSTQAFRRALPAQARHAQVVCQG